MAEIRDANSDDVQDIVPFLCQYMPGNRSAAHFERLIAYDWAEPNGSIGQLLVDEGAVKGVFAAIRSRRFVNGRWENLCSLGPWCLHPDYRNFTLPVVRAMVADKDTTYTALSPTSEMQAFWQGLRWRELDDGKEVVLPLAGLLRRSIDRRVNVLTAAEDILSHLGGEESRLYRDHDRNGCICVLLKSHDHFCLVIAVYRSWKRFGYGDILYASDWDFLWRHAGAISAVFARRMRTVFLGIDRRRLPDRLRWSWPQDRKTFFLSPTLIPDDIDGLYSELVLNYGRPSVVVQRT
ncbi:MAG: hypothetical protein HN478_07405 [Rhodospirillaceae bacterium]|mgnify:CR=1 FL=1|jgi:hypothetical protein|nr:hypothetical protein [Rhodospirillaceae bacterium]MBT4487943.1 hypothetical protein [Rhodospirillaceae bacterium]MBT5195000.1 hypothetical protein [Rhodospirillaceae bacterium]MBT5898167.1 hypothetical protein [Rhodospirillaceae bacterium]MBT6430132.1 hypothetical protein [Rhodospirillaceae bacterium]